MEDNLVHADPLPAEQQNGQLNAEPFYIRECNAIKTPEQRKAWYHDRADEAKALGAQLCRFSYHPDNESRLLVECWKEPARDVHDQGELRWALGSSQ